MKLPISVILSCFAVATVNATPRIINGAKSSSTFMASLHSFDGHFCDGTIISNQWILTAARCLVEHPIPEWIQVYVGSSKLSVGADIYDSDFLIYHEDYDEDLGINDIGLIRLRKPISFDNKKYRIDLSSRGDFKIGTSALVVGWGSTQKNGPPSDDQLTTVVRIVSAKTCKLAWQGRFDNNTQLCIVSKPGSGICYGDLGSPVVAGGYQVGITSFARTCATSKPEVVTRVLAYRDWIKNVTGIDSMWKP